MSEWFFEAEQFELSTLYNSSRSNRKKVLAGRKCWIRGRDTNLEFSISKTSFDPDRELDGFLKFSRIILSISDIPFNFQIASLRAYANSQSSLVQSDVCSLLVVEWFCLSASTKKTEAKDSSTFNSSAVATLLSIPFRSTHPRRLRISALSYPFPRR